jgi:hypothetical protein
MNKNELEAHRISVSAHKFEAFMSSLARVLVALTVLGAIYVIMTGVQTIVLAKPESIAALSTVIEKMNITGILGIFVGLLGGTGWFCERKGKQRAIRKVDELRKELEAGDPHRSSSNLDRHGHTPH